nr:hypothetical protein [Tanacetum cinerariifolium]
GSGGASGSGGVGGSDGAVEMLMELVSEVPDRLECKEKDRVKFAMATLRGRVLTWWNGRTKAIGIEATNNTPWSEVRKWMTGEFCPRSEIQRMEQELYNLRMKGMDIDGYTNRFHELDLLYKADEATEGEKRKGEGDRGSHGDNQRKHNRRQNQRRGNEGAMTNAAPNNNETCQKCKNKRHAGDCWKCIKCGTLGHKTKRCRISEMRCYNCNEKGHRKKDCPKLGRNGQGGNNRRGAYQLGVVNAQEDPKVVIGTFLLNNHYATALFDSVADRSFVSTKFSTLINIKPVQVDTSYEVKLADGKIVRTNNVLKGCTLNLLNHSFPIDLMVIELGSFDIIIGMDWLSKNDAAILCGEKKVRIPLKNKALIIEGDRNQSRLKIISCIKAQKYIENGCELFLAQVTEMVSKEKRVEDVLVIRDFPEVKNKREKDKIRTKPDQIKKKGEAWRSPEKSRAVSVDRARKTEENTKRMVKNANTVKKLLKFKERKKGQGPYLQFLQSIKFRDLYFQPTKAIPTRTILANDIYEMRD